VTFLTSAGKRSGDRPALLSDVFQLPSKALSSADSLRPGQPVWVLPGHGRRDAVYRFARVCDQQTGVKPGHVRVKFAKNVAVEVDVRQMEQVDYFERLLPVLIEEPRLLFADRAAARSPETAPAAAAAAQSGAHAGGPFFLSALSSFANPVRSAEEDAGAGTANSNRSFASNSFVLVRCRGGNEFVLRTVESMSSDRQQVSSVPLSARQAGAVIFERADANSSPKTAPLMPSDLFCSLSM
jgi:hypothetical protein